MPAESPLTGGNLSAGLVDNTVRRPTGPWTPAVHQLLHHLEAAGFDGAPRALGLDKAGREVVEFIEGQVAWPGDHRRLLGDDESMERVGGLLRSFHDAVQDLHPDPYAVWRFPEMAEDALPFLDERGLIVCHNDPGAWNLVVGPDRWAFIDWDTAGPRPPVWDVAYCAIGTVPVAPSASGAGWPAGAPVLQRLSALARGYGLPPEDLRRLPEVIVARIASSYKHLKLRAEAGMSPWDALWRQGHGDGWRSMLEFAERNTARWSAEL